MLRLVGRVTCDLRRGAPVALLTCGRANTSLSPGPSGDSLGNVPQRWFTASRVSRGDERGVPSDLSQDLEVKEWMKELHKDFSPGAANTEPTTSEEGTPEGSQSQDGKENPRKVWAQLVGQRYEKFDAHSQIIYDYDEERLRRQAGLVEEKVKQEKVRLERGKTGVFDVEELVELLREDHGQDIVVIQIPPDAKYVNYMVIVSSNSKRHTGALAELVKGAYKLKKRKKDPSVLVEGKGSSWVAMDMGNIALHIMMPDVRESYDLETLWAVGAEYDEKCQRPEESPWIGFNTSDPLTEAPSLSPTQAVT